MQQVPADCNVLTMPVGYVLVRDPRCHIEHDDAALTVDIVSVSQTTKLLLAGGVPDVKLDLAQVLCVCQTSASEQECYPASGSRIRTVVNPKGCTSTPKVAMYFFSNSPVK